MQNQYNLENNIIPKSINKSIDEIMLSTSVASSFKEDDYLIAKDLDFNEMTEDEREMILLELRKEMIGSAEKLDFEKAAKIRDEIESIEKNIKMAVT